MSVMKKELLLLLGLLSLSFSICVAQTPKNPQLAAEITRLFELDQRVQNDVVAAYQSGVAKDRIDELFKIKDRILKSNIPLLKAIIKQHGFPTYDLVGKQAAGYFLTLVQHADADVAFQKACLKHIEKLVKRKQFNGANFAFLTDRVNLNSGKPQVFGTQVTYDKDDKAVPKTLLDPKNVNKRRSSVGMETIEDYLTKVNELHQQQNKKN